jgi:hypothetical protein
MITIKNLLVCLVLFGASSFYMGWKALNNTRGLIINHMIHLSPEGASIFYWSMAALSALIAVVSILVFIIKRKNS